MPNILDLNKLSETIETKGKRTMSRQAGFNRVEKAPEGKYAIIDEVMQGNIIFSSTKLETCQRNFKKVQDRYRRSKVVNKFPNSLVIVDDRGWVQDHA